MIEHAEESQPAPMTQREQAGKFVERLEELIFDVDDAQGEAYSKAQPAPSWYVKALAKDASSLLQGIRDGYVDASQPRVATDLLQAVAELERTDHTVLAAAVSSLLRDLSSQGLAAENCQIARKRIPPQTAPAAPQVG